MTTRARNRTDRPNCRRCVNCSMSVAPNLRKRSIEDLNEQMIVILQSWIIPTPILSYDIVCLECYKLLEERIGYLNETDDKGILSPAYGHLSICFGCGTSIANARTHKVRLGCPQRTILLKWIPLHQVSRLEKVCRACWMAATRETKRQALSDSNRPDNIMETESQDLAVPEIPEPPPVAPQTQPETQQYPQAQTVPKINSSKYKRVAAGSRHCIFKGCKNKERLLVPSTLKEVLLLQNKIYIPLSARICKYHLDRNQWDELEATLTDFTGLQVDDIFSKLEKAAKRQIDFSNIDAMDPHLCHYWLGLTAEEFNELLVSIPSLKNEVPNPSLALSIFLVKRRTKDTNQKLAGLFNLPRSTLERKMNIVKKMLNQVFSDGTYDAEV